MLMVVNFRKNMNISYKRISIKVLCFFLSFVFLFANLPYKTHAVYEFTTEDYEKLGAIIIDLYGKYNNTNLALDYSADQSALTVIETLYQEYQASTGDPTILAAIGAAAIAAGCIAVVYDAITGQGKIQLYQEQFVTSLDGYWDYNCIQAGLLRDPDTGLFTWNNGNPHQIINLNQNLFNGNLVHELPVGYSFASYDGTWYKLYNAQSTVYYYIGGDLNYPNRRYISLVSSAAFTYVVETFVNGNLNKTDYYSGTYYSSYDNARAINTVDNITNNQLPIDTYESYYDYIGVGAIVTNTNMAAAMSPYFYVGDPLTYEPTITFPNPADPNYDPKSVPIQTNVEVAPEIDPIPPGVVVPTPGYPYPVNNPDDLKTIIDDIWDRMTDDDPDNDPEVERDVDPNPDPDPDPDPDDPEDPEDPDESTYHTPLLPFIPNFDFNLSSIWYYVVQWVNSFKGFMTLLFNVWSAIPYAIVLPVYATAVIVIVVGVYRKFFM